MITLAPYAAKPIPVYLTSTNAPRYRVLSCVECAEPFIERQGDDFYRIGNKDLPEVARVDSVGSIETVCGHCQQAYVVYFGLEKQAYKPDPLAYQRPQTVFLAVEENKNMRDTYCLECHHAYLSVSDRISMISDGVLTISHLVGLGPVQVRCKFKGCKQRWELMT